MLNVVTDEHFQPVYMIGESQYSSLCAPAGHKQTAWLAIQHRVCTDIPATLIALSYSYIGGQTEGNWLDCGQVSEHVTLRT